MIEKLQYLQIEVAQRVELLPLPANHKVYWITLMVLLTTHYTVINVKEWWSNSFF